MAESLPKLIARRMADLNARSVLDLYRRLPAGGDRITYETFRKLAAGEQRGTKDDRVFRDVAEICGVPANDVRAAFGAGPEFGPFELPRRAQGLSPDERSVVVSVMDAILNAKRGKGRSWGGTFGPADEIGTGEPGTLSFAARGRQGQPHRKDQEDDWEPA